MKNPDINDLLAMADIVAREAGVKVTVHLSPLPDRGEADELPWCDCKVAFDAWHDEPIWEASGGGTLALPHGWSLDGTNSSGARLVVIFRVEDVPLTSQDGEKVVRELERIGALNPTPPETLHEHSR